MIKLKAQFLSQTINKRTTTLKFKVDNNQLNELNNIDILSCIKEYGYLFFNISKVKKEVQDIMKKLVYGTSFRGVSPSKRLRGVIYMEYRNITTELTDEQYYTERMNGIIKDIYQGKR